MRRFADRASAGRELADRLSAYQGHPQAIVLGLARGGVPVAFEVARTLGLALDVFVVRKLGVPGREQCWRQGRIHDRPGSSTTARATSPPSGTRTSATGCERESA